MKPNSGLRTWLMLGIAGGSILLPTLAESAPRRGYSKQPVLQRNQRDPAAREYFPGRGIVAPPRVGNVAAMNPTGEEYPQNTAASLTNTAPQSGPSDTSSPAPYGTTNAVTNYPAPTAPAQMTPDVGYEISYDGPPATGEVPPQVVGPSDATTFEVPIDKPASTGCADCGCESDVTIRGPSLCEYNGLSRGCDRPRCPCPSDEALSYYRCGFWGHYPTFWRTWPEGFQKYRPQLNGQTIYDRYRTSGTGPAGPTVPGADADLDEQLKELLDQQQPGGPTAPRPEPELLPENAIQEQAPKSETPSVPPPSVPPPSVPPPPVNPPATPNSSAYYRTSPRSGANAPVVRPVGYWRSQR